MKRSKRQIKNTSMSVENKQKWFSKELNIIIQLFILSRNEVMANTSFE